MTVWRVGVYFEMEGVQYAKYYATEELAEEARALLDKTLGDYEYTVVEEIDVLMEIDD